MKITFDTKGNEKQKLAAKYWIDDETEELLYGGAKYGGKSFLGCSLIFGDALIYPETYYFIARNSLTDLRKYTIPSIHEVFRTWGLEVDAYAKYNGQDSYFELYNKSRVYLLNAEYSPRDPDFHRFGSIQMTRGWCEEIGEMHPKAISNLSLSVGRWKNKEYGLKRKMLYTCNPHKGYGFRNFYKPAKDGTLDKRRKFIVALPQDNKSGDPDYIEALKNNPDKNDVERLYYGNWEYDNDPSTMIKYDTIVDLFTNTIEESKEKFLIVDAARFGRDEIVFSFWKGLDWYRVEYRGAQGIDETIADIKTFAAEERIPYSHILVDEDGVGGGIVDTMKGIKGFVANRTPLVNLTATGPDNLKPNYKNLKAQCVYTMADKVNNHLCRVSFTDELAKEKLSADLGEYKTKNADKDGKKQIIGKDEMKEKLGRSPDYGDCFLMRMWFELKKLSEEKTEYKQPAYEPTSVFEGSQKNNGSDDPFDMFSNTFMVS